VSKIWHTGARHQLTIIIWQALVFFRQAVDGFLEKPQLKNPKKAYK
jgi:hypothetical protein